MLDKVKAALAAIKADGTFATEIVCTSADLQIEVKGVGPLRFPISARAARQLSAVAKLAPFGKRDQTLSDLSVRDTWEISGRQVKIDARPFGRALAPHLAVLRKRLGLPDAGALKAVFDKLLVYGPGQFFAPHQDSERDDHMIGSLVVLLPSACTGGALVVEHQGKKRIFRGARRGPKDLALIAFYADCQHEVRPVKSGYRVALTYQLHFQATERGAAPAQASEAVGRLAREVKAYFAAPQRPDRLIYLLDHEYTQKSLSFDHLKNADRLRAGALLQVAQQLNCESYLALADIYENWSCFGDDDWGRRSRRSRWSHDDNDNDDDEDDDDDGGGGEPDDYELGELCDSNIELRHFVGLDGRALKDIAMGPSDDQICYTRDSGDMDPFKSEYEGYMGNYGNTLERWYHRAALVIWPRERAFEVRAKHSSLWAVRAVAASLKARRTEEALAQARSLLPFWAQMPLSERGATLFIGLLKILAPLADAELAIGLLSPFGPDLLRGSATGPFVTLVDAFGLSWAQRLFAAWASQRRYAAPAWLPLLPDLCRALLKDAGEPGRELALWLLAQEVASFKAAREAALRPSPFSGADDPESHHDEILALLEAAAVLQAAELRDDLVALLITPKLGLPLMSAGSLLQRCRAERPPAAARALGLQALYRHVVDALTGVLAAPGRAADDWSIEPPQECNCALCKELALFLRERGQIECAWPLAEHRRRHVHDIIDRHSLPLTHTTVRRGSPFTLMLKKQQTLFERDAALRARQEALLSWLKAERSALEGGR